jgi:hypothetical protein
MFNWRKLRSGKNGLAVAPTPLPPGARVGFFFWSVPPEKLTGYRIISGFSLSAVAFWLLSQFFQLRGVVNLALSRLALLGLCICVLLFVCMFVRGSLAHCCAGDLIRSRSAH